MNEEIAKNNPYIQTWKKTIDVIINVYEILQKDNYTLSKKSNDIRELASKQLKILDDGRPNKDKSLYSQANEQQKEFVDYLELVILYGNLEGKDYVSA